MNEWIDGCECLAKYFQFSCKPGFVIFSQCTKDTEKQLQKFGNYGRVPCSKNDLITDIIFDFELFFSNYEFDKMSNCFKEGNYCTEIFKFEFIYYRSVCMQQTNVFDFVWHQPSRKIVWCLPKMYTNIDTISVWKFHKFFFIFIIQKYKFNFFIGKLSSIIFKIFCVSTIPN